MLLFNRWEAEGVEVSDLGLKNVIDVAPAVIPHTFGRHEHSKFAKSRVNIVERLANSIMHFGKKHAKNTGRMAGKKQRAISIVKAPFHIIHLKTGKNPLQVLVKAVESVSPNEDTTRISYGGVVYHLSVDLSPQRRVDLALRFIAEAVREAAFSSQKAVEEVLADELIAASQSDSASPAIKKKTEQERMALASR